jgi:hypothetical protein
MISERMKVSGASFRDPSGFVVERDGEFLRVVQPAYAEHYKCLFDSGLYEELTGRGLLIPHEEIATEGFDGAFKVLRPRQLPYVSYPYEWCFSQLKDAALATLAIQKTALSHGMMLKDAPAFNLQFLDGKPVLIDTLSFEKLRLEPWAAYGQFCRHFLAPLALISLCDPRLGRLSQIHLDGIPLGVATRLLPWRGRLNFWLLVHLYWHAANEQRELPPGAGAASQAGSGKLRLSSLQGLVAGLEAAVKKLRWQPPKTAWATYYASSVTGGKYVEHKQQVVAEFLKSVQPRSVWDLGANTGLFSRLAADAGAETVSFDADSDCVEINYLQTRKEGGRRLLPLWMDLTNPSPALGWEHRERLSWLERRPPDMTLALGLVHHLAIANNLPLERIRDFFGRLGPWLAVEFVPKEDPNARKLLRVREDIFPGYTRENFEREFSRGFAIQRSAPLQDSPRVLYLMRNQRNA